MTITMISALVLANLVVEGSGGLPTEGDLFHWLNHSVDALAEVLPPFFRMLLLLLALLSSSMVVLRRLRCHMPTMMLFSACGRGCGVAGELVTALLQPPC